MTKFERETRTLRGKVSPEVWEAVKRRQPFFDSSWEPELHPLSVLHHMSNLHKHRQLHAVRFSFVDLGHNVMTDPPDLVARESWFRSGPAKDGDVIARLKVRRPAQSMTITVVPSFAYVAELKVRDEPVVYVALHELMEAVRQYAIAALVDIAAANGDDVPEVSALELGDHHEAHRPEAGGNALFFRDANGNRHIRPLGPDGPS